MTNLKLSLSKEVVQAKSSFLIGHGKRPADAWEDVYGPDGSSEHAPFTKLLVLYETKKQDKAKEMADTLTAHYDKFFSKELPAIKATWLGDGSKKAGFIPGLPPFFVWAAVKEAAPAATPSSVAAAAAAAAADA